MTERIGSRRPRLLAAALTAALCAAAAALTTATPAAADDGGIPTGQIMQAGFPPCEPPPGTPWQPGPPPIEWCVDTAPKVTAECDPDGVSTVSVTREGFGWNGLFGQMTETVTATIGPQTGPAQPEIQVLSSGIRNGSVGFPTGRLLSFESSFTFTTWDGLTTITGTKRLVDDLANVGVCREYEDSPTHSTLLGPAPLSGYFYMVNAQVLAYDATITAGGIATEDSGVAETYLSNSFACCAGGSVNASTGHLATSFGTTHSAVGTPTSAPTPAGANVAVTPAPGVELVFDGVTTPGTTTVRATQTVPDVPAGLQVGDPPAFYEISTTAAFEGGVTICVPYGGAPPGTVPALWHYTGGAWEDVTTSYDELLRIICGRVTSFSPFAVLFRPAGPSYTLTGPFRPVEARPAVNAAEPGRTIPVKFSLGGAHGLDVFAAGYPRSDGGACGGASTGEPAAAGPEGLAYDAATGVYTFHWKTSRSWKGQCRTLTLRFADGSELVADFRFR